MLKLEWNTVYDGLDGMSGVVYCESINALFLECIYFGIYFASCLSWF